MPSHLVIWDVDGTLIPADLRWLRRAVARTYDLAEAAVTFPTARVHGYTDESIVVDTAIGSGVTAPVAEDGVPRFYEVLAQVMADGREELVREQSPYAGAREAIDGLHKKGYIHTVLTGNLQLAAEAKLRYTGLDQHLDLAIGGYGSDARDRFDLPAIVRQRFVDRYGQALDRARTVVIGDAANDIACARHGGFHVIAVAHRMSRVDLEALKPDAVLDHLGPAEVVQTVKSLIGVPVSRESLSSTDEREL